MVTSLQLILTDKETYIEKLLNRINELKKGIPCSNNCYSNKDKEIKTLKLNVEDKANYIDKLIRKIEELKEAKDNKIKVLKLNLTAKEVHITKLLNRLKDIKEYCECKMMKKLNEWYVYEIYVKGVK